MSYSIEEVRDQGERGITFTYLYLPYLAVETAPASAQTIAVNPILQQRGKNKYTSQRGDGEHAYPPRGEPYMHTMQIAVLQGSP